MRTQLDKHIEIHKLGIRFIAILASSEKREWQGLGSSFDLADLVEDCELNSTFDRNIETLRLTEFFKLRLV